MCREMRLGFNVSHFHAQILGEWFGRSVIRSCAKLSYSHAQVG